METLSDELLGAVASFLPSVKDLEALSLSNHRLCSWVVSSKTADGIFRDLYQYHFHGSAPCSSNHHVVSGRQLWRDTYCLCKSLELGRRDVAAAASSTRANGHSDDGDENGEEVSNTTVRTEMSRYDTGRRRCVSRSRGAGTSSRRRLPDDSAHAAVAAQPLNTVEILPPEEEAEAILYDNHDFSYHNDEDTNSNRQPCVGYFGMQPLQPFRGGASADVGDGSNTSMIAIWGDFRGLRVAPCWDALLNSRSEHRDRLLSIHDKKQSQVMDLKVHPQWDALASSQGYTSPFFLAFASGVVMAVAARHNDNHHHPELKIVSTSAAHSSEVTSLAIVPSSSSSSRQKQGYLVSACVSGDVYLYPDSLTKLSLAGRICLNPSNVPKFPLFSMSASLFATPNQAVLCLGGQGLKVSLWKLTEQSSSNGSGIVEVTSTHEFEYQPHVSFQDRDVDDNHDEHDQVDHSITHVSFVGPVVSILPSSSSSTQNKKDLLVMGTSRGHIVTWDLQGHVEDPHRPELVIRTSHERVHSGGVESTERVRNILLTMGGNDGVIKGLDLETGLPMASLLVHPGRLLAPPTRAAAPVRLKCAVVKSWVCCERQSIIGFCRDGHISEWTFQLHKLPSSSSLLSNKSKNNNNASTNTKKKRAITDGTTNGGKRSRRHTVNQNQTILQTTSAIDPSNNQAVRASSSSQACVSLSKSHYELSMRETQPTDDDVTGGMVVLHGQQPAPIDNYKDVPSALAALPQEAKDLFNQLAFCKRNHLYRPVLILSPLAVPEGPIRDAWLQESRTYLKQRDNQQEGNNNTSQVHLTPPCLVFWLGVQDSKRAYSMIPAASKITTYKEGIGKNYHHIANRIRQRIIKGQPLKRYEQQYVDGLGVLQMEAAKAPENRSHLLQHFVTNNTHRKVAPEEEDPQQTKSA